MEDVYWIWLSRINALGPITILELLKKFKNPENIWNAEEKDLIEKGFTGKILSEILNKKYRENLDKYINYMEKNEIKIINFYDNSYPEKLRNIYAFPITLYAKGDVNILNDKSIAIVGCRDSTVYGEKYANQFAYELAKNNINIVSGMAKGIDTCAHLGCIKAKGKNISVMGCGLDTVYPSQNKNIWERILQDGGVIVSEYIIGTKPMPENFPRRNRIISGLSDGVLVIEAKEKSGTLITVDYAIEQGKEIYVIPGNIDSKNSYGTNNLIRQGAQIVTETEDILLNMR